MLSGNDRLKASVDFSKMCAGKCTVLCRRRCLGFSCVFGRVYHACRIERKCLLDALHAAAVSHHCLDMSVGNIQSK